MRKTLAYIFAAILIVGSSIEANEVIITPIKPPMELPEKFYVTEHWFSWTRTFDIETDFKKLGTVHRKWLSLRLEYDFYDFLENLQARAVKRLFSYGALFDVTDVQDAAIGSVEEHIFSFFETFSMYSPSGDHLATAKLNFWGTQYTMTSPHFSEPIATLSRSFFRLKDNWEANILNQEAFAYGKIDPRLFIVVMAFQTDIDYWKRQQDHNGSSPIVANLEGKKDLQIDIVQNEMQLMEGVLRDYQAMLPEDFMDTDIEEVELITDLYLDDQAQQNPANEAITDDRVRVLNGCQALLPMLQGDRLTEKQKGALATMLEQQLIKAQQ